MEDAAQSTPTPRFTRQRRPRRRGMGLEKAGSPREEEKEGPHSWLHRLLGLRQPRHRGRPPTGDEEEDARSAPPFPTSSRLSDRQGSKRPHGKRLAMFPPSRRVRRAAALVVLLSTLHVRYWVIGRVRAPLACNLLNLRCPTWPVSGYVHPDYQSCLDVFLANFHEGIEVGSSFTAYVGGRVVAELYGGYHDKHFRRLYTRDALQLVFSSSKVVEGLVIAFAVDQGWLRYEDRIATHWPEFAQGNKENVTLKALLGHRAGLTYLDRQPTLAEIADLDLLAKLLAAQPHNFQGAEVQGYHAVTRGWYLNELLRRVDPQHRTMGQLLREELMPRLEAEFYLGLPPELEHRVSPLVGYPPLRMLAKLLFPARLQQDPLPSNLHSILFDRTSIPWKATVGSNPKQLGSWPHSHNRREITRAEGPSFSGITNARSLARVALLLANGGWLPPTDAEQWDLAAGVTRPMMAEEGEGGAITDDPGRPAPPPLLSKRTMHLAREPQAWMQDQVVRRNVTFATGGWGVNLTIPGTEGVPWSGWGGVGGSLVLWNEERGIALSYVMNSLTFAGLGDRRGWRLVAEVTRVANALVAAAASPPSP